ncbi:hypothetical protein RINTU1_25930 [Candidatus Regiella insecticola]|uniref:Uncharacterized protein n=1 Tax=Candidatus Regiella insecticola TaxID=138073 RepID=A0A6L2ZQZ4_9ENTR|nr:hypothetical protein RINTU1_25930 [Candidatus Regiella insecticola]
MKKPAIPFAFQVTALLSAGARLMVCLRSSVGRPCRLAVTRNPLGILCDKQGKKNEQRIEGGYPGCGAWYQNAACN